MPLDDEVPTPHPLSLRYRFVSKVPWFDPPCKPRLSASARGRVSASTRKAIPKPEDADKPGRASYSEVAPGDPLLRRRGRHAGFGGHIPQSSPAEVLHRLRRSSSALSCSEPRSVFGSG